MKKKLKMLLCSIGAALIAALVLSVLFFLFSFRQNVSFVELYFAMLIGFGGPALLQGLLTFAGVFTEKNDKYSFQYCAGIYYGGYFIKHLVSAYCYSEELSYIIGYLIAVLACLVIHLAFKTDELKKEIAGLEYVVRHNGKNT